ncbi:hypothetical protein E2C01_021969 [Portunus trituberculatus]|uniref:Uncharacterized protein n=1 Tax=Portunus trituberculatus TaxID=210409 RepID=A0A5B7E4T5_PORTR|nr:hypothetical protein [Portunus trituberculatus]
MEVRKLMATVFTILIPPHEFLKLCKITKQ